MKPCDTMWLPPFLFFLFLQRCFFYSAQPRGEKGKKRGEKENRAQHVFCERSLDKLGCSSKTFLPLQSRTDTVERKTGARTSVSKHLLKTSCTFFLLLQLLPAHPGWVKSNATYIFFFSFLIFKQYFELRTGSTLAQDIVLGGLFLFGRCESTTDLCALFMPIVAWQKTWLSFPRRKVSHGWNKERRWQKRT